MSDAKDELIISALSSLNDDIRQIDNKLDYMNEVLNKNTAILVEHERRSTASEDRLDVVEERYYSLEKSAAGVKSFFIYSGVILSTVATLIVIYTQIIEHLGK